MSSINLNFLVLRLLLAVDEVAHL